mgnify:CR=1 FL=1
MVLLKARAQCKQQDICKFLYGLNCTKYIDNNMNYYIQSGYYMSSNLRQVEWSKQISTMNKHYQSTSCLI